MISQPLTYQYDTFNSAFRPLAACCRVAESSAEPDNPRPKRRIPEVESATAPRNPEVPGCVDVLRAADAAKPNHKGTRNDHRVKHEKLIKLIGP